MNRLSTSSHDFLDLALRHLAVIGEHTPRERMRVHCHFAHIFLQLHILDSRSPFSVNQDRIRDTILTIEPERPDARNDRSRTHRPHSERMVRLDPAGD